jgi:hypothetical protein
LQGIESAEQAKVHVIRQNLARPLSAPNSLLGPGRRYREYAISLVRLSSMGQIVTSEIAFLISPDRSRIPGDLVAKLGLGEPERKAADGLSWRADPPARKFEGSETRQVVSAPPYSTAS